MIDWKKAVIATICFTLACGLAWHNGHKIGQQDLCNAFDGEMVSASGTPICLLDRELIRGNQAQFINGGDFVLDPSFNISIGRLK